MYVLITQTVLIELITTNLFLAAKSLQRWSHESILLLLSTYEDHLKMFKSGKKTGKAIWNMIAKAMVLKGYNVSGEQCDIKFRNLKKTYKRIVDNNKGTGNGSISWLYFEKFNAIFGKNADIVPISTASSSSSFSEACSFPLSEVSTNNVVGVRFRASYFQENKFRFNR